MTAGGMAAVATTRREWKVRSGPLVGEGRSSNHQRGHNLNGLIKHQRKGKVQSNARNHQPINLGTMAVAAAAAGPDETEAPAITITTTPGATSGEGSGRPVISNARGSGGRPPQYCARSSTSTRAMLTRIWRWPASRLGGRDRDRRSMAAAAPPWRPSGWAPSNVPTASTCGRRGPSTNSLAATRTEHESFSARPLRSMRRIRTYVTPLD
mmetsp:Transcript_11094/g.31191  ORF Transcript_11094/g.31191 Transcript_11094/m.31191 type:complete len:210 (-) Transcript_11094:290-919(-)